MTMQGVRSRTGDELAAPPAATMRDARRPESGPDRQTARLVRGLGWFSVGLGLLEIAAPRQLSTVIGVPEHRGLLRMLGLRELLSGAGILADGRLGPWMWSRVGGDVVDLALLGGALTSPRAERGRVAAALGAVGGVAALDLLCAQRLDRDGTTTALEDGIAARRSIALKCSPEEAYRFWRDLENLPRFMTHLESVRATSAERSHWIAKGPAGARVEWNAEIVADEPGRTIAWRSLPNADVDSRGSVRFEAAPGGRGTYLVVEMHYRPPAGAAGALVAKLLGKDPAQQMATDLRRLKNVLETGEVVSNEGPSGRGRGLTAMARAR